MGRSSMFVSAIVIAILATTGCATESSDSASTSGEAITSDPSLSSATVAKAKKILSTKITNYYEGDGTTFGVVTEHGTPTLSATDDANVVQATGEFEDNELWGGAYLYKYDVDVDLTTGLIKQLKKPEMVKEIN